MKFCPTCQTRYDEEILRFCTKDGTPLVEENQPNFSALPSENSTMDDDAGEETVIRRKPPAQPDFQEKPPSAPRIVIPTGEELRAQNVRTRPTAYQAPPPPRSGTTKVVLLTVLGTIAVLCGIGGVFWFLQSDRSDNANTNINISNVNTNPPTNLNIGNPFNVNLNVNTNVNAVSTNANAVRTPTPTPKPSPTPTPTPRTSPETNSNASTNSAAPPANTRPSPTATPTPTPENSAPPANRPVNVGVLNSRALNLPTPAYPTAARTMRASGRVTVQVTVDETGNVSSAKATSGHPLLRQAAEAAARQSRFSPIIVNNQAVAATGLLVYNFVN